ncbi:MAG: shikimate kinase [Geminicoccaceae bacterium]|nr:shikimate kinase [Geminicoccaceae bacterium]MCB9944302.1 shikimate kinase [Geminicoccaceae bacterium]
MSESAEQQPPDNAGPLIPLTPVKTIVLVGLMGAGKTAIGKRLAASLGVRFADADAAIIEAAGMGIPDIFELYGEETFRDLERRVILRMLEEEPFILALGGGAFINDETRAAIKRSCLSIWLKADLDTLVDRVNRKKGTRPLLASGNPRDILENLMTTRYPIYAHADRVFESNQAPPEKLVERIRNSLIEEGMVNV